MTVSTTVRPRDMGPAVRASAASEMGVDEGQAIQRGIMDDVDESKLHACHGVGYVDQAQLESPGALRIVPKNSALESVHILGLVHQPKLKAPHVIDAPLAVDVAHEVEDGLGAKAADVAEFHLLDGLASSPIEQPHLEAAPIVVGFVNERHLQARAGLHPVPEATRLEPKPQVMVHVIEPPGRLNRKGCVLDIVAQPAHLDAAELPGAGQKPAELKADDIVSALAKEPLVVVEGVYADRDDSEAEAIDVAIFIGDLDRRTE